MSDICRLQSGRLNREAGEIRVERDRLESDPSIPAFDLANRLRALAAREEQLARNRAALEAAIRRANV